MNKKKKMTIKRPNFSQQLEALKEKCAPITHRIAPYWQRLPRFHQKALTVLAPVTFILILLPSGAPLESSITPMVGVTTERQSISLNLEGLSEQQGHERDEAEPVITAAESTEKRAEPVTTPKKKSPLPKVKEAWRDYTIKKGDTLYKVFRANGLPLGELNKILAVEGSGRPLSSIKKGQLVRYKLNAQGELDALQLETKGEPILFFRLSNGNFGRSK